jgi:hypothetical protein
MEDLLPKSRRQRLFESLGFDAPLEFDRGDIGVPGGLQVTPQWRPLLQFHAQSFLCCAFSSDLEGCSSNSIAVFRTCTKYNIIMQLYKM